MKIATIQEKIVEIKGERVILDFDIAKLYGVETRTLNQSVKRNMARFPADFIFQLTQKEFDNLISQNVISSWGGIRKLPFAFTEHGVAMLASIIRSEQAVKMNIAIVRAFIALRQIAVQNKEIADKLAMLESQYNQQFKDVYEALNFLMGRSDIANRERIGFTK